MAETELTTEDILALIEQGPQATSQALPPIGVPAVVMGESGAPEPFSVNGVEPRYVEGDQFALLAAMGPRDIERLQYLMVAAGVIPKGTTYYNGRIDDVTVSAFEQVLSHANRSGMNPEQALRDLSTATRIGEGPQVQPYLRPDPASVRQRVRGSFAEAIGRDVTDAELPGLVDEYFRMDQAGYQSDTAQMQANPDATSLQATDPGARFEEYLLGRYRPEIERRDRMVDLAQSNEKLMANVFALDRSIA